MCSTHRSLKMTLMVGVVLSIAAGQAGAAVVFNTFGPGNSYDVTSGSPVGLFAGLGNVAAANQFSVPGSGYYLDTIELAAGLSSGTNRLDVSLTADASGQPGAVIESFSFIDQMGSFGNNNPLLVGTSVLRPVLTAGTDYWLVASAPIDTSAVWNASLEGIKGLHGLQLNAAPWSIVTTDLDAFRVTGTPVIPVPGALLLGGIGLTLVGWARRHRAM